MKVQDILTDESRWCKEHCAYDAFGLVVSPSDEKAVKWCLLGALTAAGLWNSPENNRLTNEIMERFGTGVSVWNDKVTFPEVRALIEELDI